MARSKVTLHQEAEYMNATGITFRAETLRMGLGPYMNPIGWTVVRREIGPGRGRVVPRTARAKDNRAPSAVCGCCIPRR
jgi:hypothetical protein